MIDISELNTWISSTEGAAWLEQQKAPLVAKRDELLESLRQANGKAAEASRAKADAEALLAAERKALERIVVDDALEAALKQAHVYEAAVPGLIAELKEAHGFTAQADGLGRKAARGKLRGADGAEREVGLEEAVAAFLQTDRGKANVRGGLNSGGGASAGESFRPAPALRLDARELGRMSESDFQAAIAAVKGNYHGN